MYWMLLHKYKSRKFSCTMKQHIENKTKLFTTAGKTKKWLYIYGKTNESHLKPGKTADTNEIVPINIWDTILLFNIWDT